MIYDFMM